MLQRLQMLSRSLRALPLTAALLAAALALGPAAPARAQGIDLATLQLLRNDGALALEWSARVRLSRAAEHALERGVPVYFVAQATLYRERWYWRDERVARVSRTFRLAHQPLTGQWRVGVGAIQQTYATLAEALAAISRTSGWRIAEPAQIDPDSRHYVEFEFRLDTARLPSPMQIGLTGQADWTLRLERTLRVE
jgi:hypothetical protein